MQESACVVRNRESTPPHQPSHLRSAHLFITFLFLDIPDVKMLESLHMDQFDVIGLITVTNFK